MLIVPAFLLIGSVLSHQLLPRGREESDRRFYSQSLYEKSTESGSTMFHSLSVNQQLMMDQFVTPPVSLYRRVYSRTSHRFKDGYVRHMYKPIDFQLYKETPPMPKNPDADEMHFIAWEAEEVPTSASLYTLMHFDHDFLDKAILGSNQKFQNLVPDVAHLALDRDPELANKIMNHPNLVDWPSTPQASNEYIRYILKPVKYAELLSSLVIRQTKNPQVVASAVEKLTSAQVADMFNAMLQKRLTAGKYTMAAPILLHRPEILNKLQDGPFAEFMKVFLEDAMNGAGVVRLFTMEHIASRISGADLGKMLTVFSLQQNAKEELIMLTSAPLMERIPDADLNTVVNDFVKKPGESMLVQAFSEEHLVTRITSENWQNLMYLFVINAHPMSASLLSNSNVMARIQDQTLQRLITFMMKQPVNNAPMIAALASDHLVFRVGSGRWYLILNSLLVYNNPALEAILNQPALAQVLTQEDTTKLITIMKGNSWSPETLNIISKSAFASRIPDQDWAEILESLANRKRFQAVDVLLTNKELMERIPEATQSKALSALGSDMSFIGKLSATSSDRVAKHALSQGFKNLVSKIPGRRPPRIENTLRTPRIANVPKVLPKPVGAGVRLRSAHVPLARVPF